MSGAAIGPDPLELVAWSLVWSPLPGAEVAENAWRALDIPLNFQQSQPAMIRCFQAGNPAPLMPLQLHAALALDGGECRELFVRIMQHLDLDWARQPLPPDHLALVCEMLACAAQNDDPVLVEGLLERFLRPWCARARHQLGPEHELNVLPMLFLKSLH